MKEFRADPAAAIVLQVTACLLAALLSLAAGHFLRHWPTVMWIVIGIFSAAALLLSFLLVPLFFRRLRCTVTASQITVYGGIFMTLEQSVRMDRVQFVQLLSGPFDGALGLNFATLYVYGGQLTVPFMKRSDRNALAELLQQKGVFHAS